MNVSTLQVRDQQDEQMPDNLPMGDDLLELPEYRLHISRDRVAVLLDCPTPHSGTNDLIRRILDDFQLLGIPEYPDAETLNAILLSSCKPGQSLREQTILMGQAASPSINGHLEWARDFFAKGWEVDEETGAIDFWAKCESRAVVKGELMVCLHHPIDGIPGLNVFGKEIPVSKPSKVKLRSGKDVNRIEKQGFIAFEAKCEGRVRHADGIVSVDNVYMIKSDVSLKTGNVVHTGAVVIQGDVGHGATLEVEGDIIVKGMLEPCNIKCGGSLTVAGGIVGEKGFRIELGGDLLARYISEANLEVGGDVLVGNEISHSRIMCLGKVTVPKGRIAGGTTSALRGIRIGIAGAGGSSNTHLIAGVDFTLTSKFSSHEKKIIRLEKAQEKIQNAVKIGKRKLNPTAEEIKAQNFFTRKSKKIDQAIAEHNLAIHELKTNASGFAVEEILVLEELWCGTTIQLGKEKRVVRSSVLKPRFAQKRNNRVHIGALGEGNMPED